MASDPLVTCVIPTVDRPFLLRRALHSVSEQTYDNIEIIVVASPPHESTRQVLKKYNAGNKHMVPIYTDKMGMNVARNIGIREASGDLIALLDDDDIWKSKKIQKQIPYMETYSIVSCRNLAVTEKGTYESGYNIVKELDINKVFYWVSVLVPSGTVFRTSELNEIGGFDESIRFGELWDVALKIMERYDSCYILDQILSFYDRKHGQERFSDTENHENLDHISKVYHRHKDNVQPKYARKTLVKLKYAHYREIDYIRKYMYLFSGLLRDFELVILKGDHRPKTRSHSYSVPDQFSYKVE